MHNSGSAPHWPKASSARPRPGSAQPPVPAPDWPAGPAEVTAVALTLAAHVDGVLAPAPRLASPRLAWGPDCMTQRQTDRRTDAHTSMPEAQKPEGNAGVTLA